MAESVAVCGLGGLGSNLAVMLVRAGVRRIHIIDFDRVDGSNLNRQYYFRRNIGEYKTDSLAEIIRDISPDTEITAHCVRLGEENIPELLRDDDIICECFDGAEEKALLVNTVLEIFPEKYIVSGSGMAGLETANNITTRRITKRLYLCGDGQSDIADGTGIFSSRVMLCSAHQANAVLRILSGKFDV